MVDVKTAILINCPIEKVSEYAANPDNAPEWNVNIQAVDWKTPRPLAFGSLLAFRARVLGRELSYVSQVIEWMPGRKLVMTMADGQLRMEITYLWEAIDKNATRMTLINRGTPMGFSKMAAPLMSMAMKRANKKELRKLKTILEKR
jgi:hypothetical protein